MTRPILIVGAGPTGLVLGVSLARRGVPFRLVDDDPGPGEHSRAMVVHARTLEFYQQLGFADDVVASGVKVDVLHLREAAAAGSPHEWQRIDLENIGAGISPFPFALAYPQDDHERFLVDRLRAAGQSVEWSTTLSGFTQDGDGVHATLSHADGRTEELDADYVCGCDGTHSRVRETLGVGFAGGTYEQLFYVADVRIASGFDHDLYITLGERILSLMLPVRSTGMQRFIGLVPPELSQRDDLGFEDIRSYVEPQLGVHVSDVNWFSTYRVHHRVADHFRVGRAFLLGDAAHVHSPAGAQGMNTGIGDAVNLGWKLAHVQQHRAGAGLLDTYEPERIGFARLLVATTDRGFTPLVAGGILGEVTRRIIAPMVFTVATRFSATRHAFFRTLSQTHIHYADSALSEGEAGDVRGGDRLPWTGAAGDDNFAPLRSADWQVHVYGVAADAVRRTCERLGLPLHIFPWSDAARDAGFERDANYLVRPDGYVAVAAGRDEAERLEALMQGIAPR